jgi:hypothetical protein
MARRNDTGETGRRSFVRVIGLGTAAVGASSLLTSGAPGLKSSTNPAGRNRTPTRGRLAWTSR